jgi:outer membrane protein assembly factor BamD (BamD/ComL family)
MGAPDHLVSMSYRIKVPTKTLQVDEAHLLSGLEHQLHRLQEYRRPLLVGLAVLLLAGAAVGGVFWLDRQATEKAQELDREASLLLMARSTADSKNAESLLNQAMAKYREIVEQYPRTAAAPLALFHLGNAQFQANDLAAAIDTYQRFLVLYGGNPALGALVQQRLAYSYLLKGDREQAAKAFSAIVGSPGALLKDQALFELARLEESQSRPEGAIAHYQELIKTYPSSPFTSEAAIRTKVLDVKSKEPAAPPPAPTAPTKPKN